MIFGANKLHKATNGMLLIFTPRALRS